MRLDPEDRDADPGSSPIRPELALGAGPRPRALHRNGGRGSLNSAPRRRRQTRGGKPTAFSSWSDGGARSHDVAADTGMSLPATYTTAANAYAPTVLADTPFLFWRLGETSGSFANSSGRGNVGTLNE